MSTKSKSRRSRAAMLTACLRSRQLKSNARLNLAARVLLMLFALGAASLAASTSTCALTRWSRSSPTGTERIGERCWP